MDMCNNLLLLCVLTIPLSSALHSITSPAISHNTTENNITGTTQINNNISNTSNDLATTANTITYSTENSSTIPNTHNSTNSTQHKSTVPSPTAPTDITTGQITASATSTSLATQSASEPTRAALSTVSTTVSSPVSTVHGINESTSNSTPAYFTTGTTLGNKTNNETAGAGLNHSEKSLTILFSVVLGVIVLIVLGLVYKVTRSKQRRVQYSHHPLHNEDTGEQFAVPDDTLVISGGLYDGPQIYNSTVTALNEDQTMFAYTPTQLRLEFLQENLGTDRTYEPTNFKTFNTTVQEPY